jgi:hypothetical protein
MNDHFRLCVFAFDTAHVIASYFFGEHICHRAKSGAFYFLFSKTRIPDIYLPLPAGRLLTVTRGLTFGADFDRKMGK